MNENIDVYKRLTELADEAYRENRYVYTDFLSIAQISVYNKSVRDFDYAGSESYGGYETAERRIVKFGSKDNYGYDEAYPVKLLKIEPIIAKFSDNLTHRDFLGSVLGLGIKREKIGDIIVYR
jgi:RNA-binding protein YlmH